MSDEQTLAGLIADRKGTRSYEKVSQDCGGIPTSKRLHQLATQKPKNFPDPDTIRGLAQGLGVTITDIVMASARSLDLPVYTGNDPSALAIGGAGDLPDSTKEVLSTVAREFIKLTSQRPDGANNESGTEEVQEPRTQAGGTKHSGKAGADRVRSGAPMNEPEESHGDNVTALKHQDQGSRVDDDNTPPKPATTYVNCDHGDDAPPFDPSKVLAAKRGKKSDTQ
ncbi:hypothetical protein [Rhodococcus rhodochrous]|uniref:hypothetical protein n=1 Tax=Rhodococcus rhodochrous TaxID=1829 RepID=UPI00128F9FF3|nr:hypothetical protein [Rhodococcus rhodochrous]